LLINIEVSLLCLSRGGQLVCFVIPHVARFLLSMFKHPLLVFSTIVSAAVVRSEVCKYLYPIYCQNLFEIANWLSVSQF
jgi:hypothetical protein